MNGDDAMLLVREQDATKLQRPPVRGGLDDAVQHWRQHLGDSQVICNPGRVSAYTRSTSAIRRSVTVVLQPRDRQQVAAIVRTAGQFAIPLYPISTGRNWGYGTANPPVNNCAIVDLSGLNRIVEVDRELGVATLEPGVTQQQLYEYLREHELPFCVPVHGGGPDCSLVGNALERGYGITPHADHFGALMSLTAVLPNGEIYESPLAGLGASDIVRAFKWGIGPYVDGLFTQGNFGIVTQASIALAPRAAQTTAFLFALKADADLEAAVVAVRDLQRRLGSLCTGINLMNDLRVLSMTVPYPREQVPPGAAIPAALVTELARKNHVAPWTGIGALQGEPRVVRAALGTLKRRLRPHVCRLIAFDQRRLRLLRQAARFLPGRWQSVVTRQLSAAGSFLDIARGKPSRVALKLAYWRSGRPVNVDETLNPAADSCGLRWYSPLVPMKPEAVRSYVALVTETCRRHGLDPLITLTSLSDRCFDSTVPLLFDTSDPVQVVAARTCHDELLDAGRSRGFVPYRVGVDHMDWAVDAGNPYWSTVARLKHALDPQHLIAPGRYCPLPQPT